jgi:hypothetical protein
MSTSDGLDRWIGDLRDDVERGDLMELPPFDLGDGTTCLPGEVTVRCMLADLGDLDATRGSAARDPAWREERRRRLLDDFRRFRVLLSWRDRAAQLAR